MRWLWRLLVPVGPFGLFLEGMDWCGSGSLVFDHGRVYSPEPVLTPVDDPGQVGPLRSDPEHYDAMGRYLWWGC